MKSLKSYKTFWGSDNFKKGGYKNRQTKETQGRTAT